MRDFAPYIAKIKASGADTVITGNWGSDLSLLSRRPTKAGYNGKFYTYYTGVTGTPSALGHDRGAGKVYQIAYIATTTWAAQMDKWMKDFNAEVQRRLLHLLGAAHAARCLGQAMAKAKSTDPVKVAAAMEGMKFKSFNGERRDAQERPPAAAAAVHGGVAARPMRRTRTAPERTGMTLVPVKEYRAVRVEHADELPDEAACPAPDRRRCATRRGPDRVRRVGPVARCNLPRTDVAAMEFFTISMLNGLSYGLLLFMLSSGLTLIFSMMGVLNFAHASFYMLGRVRRLLDRAASSASGPR